MLFSAPRLFSAISHSHLKRRVPLQHELQPPQPLFVATVAQHKLHEAKVQAPHRVEEHSRDELEGHLHRADINRIAYGGVAWLRLASSKW